MHTSPVGRALLSLGSLYLLGSPPAAWAGTHVWTPEHPHPKRWNGNQVLCSPGRRACRHAPQTLVVRHNGLRYQSTARVVRAKSGYGVRVRVQITAVDGQTHGLLRSLLQTGKNTPLRGTWGVGWGFGSGMGLPRRWPQIRPGRAVTLRSSYPYKPRTSAGIQRGYRFTLSLAATAFHYHLPPGHRRTWPTVAVVQLTVPAKGPPRIRLRAPRP